MDSVMNAIQDEVGLEIRFEGASVEDYYTRLTPMMGSGDWPDIIWSDPENSAGAFQNWADPAQDMLWNLDELLIGNEERYPYLNKLIYSDQYKNIMYYDGHYIVPEVQTSTAWAIYYRADWLEAIGFVDDEGNARAPVTLDEFEYVMSRFGHGSVYRCQRQQIGHHVRHFSEHVQLLRKSAVRCVRHYARLGYRR